MKRNAYYRALKLKPRKKLSYDVILHKLYKHGSKLIRKQMKNLFPCDGKHLPYQKAKLEGLPLNRALRDENGNIYDIIAGTFFLCGAPPDSEDFTSLTDEQLAHYTNRFRFIEFYIPEVRT